MMIETNETVSRRVETQDYRPPANHRSRGSHGEDEIGLRRGRGGRSCPRHVLPATPAVVKSGDEDRCAQDHARTRPLSQQACDWLAERTERVIMPPAHWSTPRMVPRVSMASAATFLSMATDNTRV